MCMPFVSGILRTICLPGMKKCYTYRERAITEKRVSNRQPLRDVLVKDLEREG